MWHLGTADTMFAVASTASIVWNPETLSFILKSDCVVDDDDDSDFNF
jgi:hypothetical protein